MVLVNQPQTWLCQSVTGVIRGWLVGYEGTQAPLLRALRRVKSSCLSLQMPRPSCAPQSAGGPWSITSGKANLALLCFWLNAAPAGPAETTWPSAKMYQTPGSISPGGCTAAENAAAKLPYAPPPSADDTAAACGRPVSDSPVADRSDAARSVPCPGPGERRYPRSIRRADLGGASPPVDRPPAAVAQTLPPVPAMKESVTCTLEAELPRQILPFGTVVRQPEDPDLLIALVGSKVVPPWRFFRGSGMRVENPWSTAAPGLSTMVMRCHLYLSSVVGELA
ncbi:MAG: hypothetical protein KatS3mg132_636 [Limisphaera sp.]|nr:MAG: hypothetical protein KatS3mg132_636 [Limisphaera sp.]